MLSSPTYRVNRIEEDLFLGEGRTVFHLKNDNNWPRGTYKADIFLDGENERTVEFKVN